MIRFMVSIVDLIGHKSRLHSFSRFCFALVEWSPQDRIQLAADRPGLVTKGRVIRPFRSRFDSDFVVHSEPELLLAAEVMFCCLNRHMAKEELDLVELAAGQMTQTRTCASKIMRRQLLYPGGLSRFLDDLPKHLRRHALAPDLSGLIDCSKQAAVVDSTCLGPAIDRLLHPKWNRYRPNMPGLSMEIGDHPVLFSELNRAGRQSEELTAPQSTTNQESKDGIVALAPETIALGFQQQGAALIGGQPVAQADADPAHAFDSANAGRKLWTEQAGISCFVRHTPDRGQAQIDRCWSEAPLF